MTGRAAAALGLADRGLLAEGQVADVVLFDPATIIDRSTYDDPHQYPAGIGTVIVNGTIVIDGGEHTGALQGRLLRRRRLSRRANTHLGPVSILRQRWPLAAAWADPHHAGTERCRCAPAVLVRSCSVIPAFA